MPPAVLMLGSYRSNDANDSPFLTEWHARVAAEGPMKQVTVKVSPLTKEQCLALLASRLGEVDDSLREQAAVIFQRTRGNPYFVEQLIEGADAENREFQTVPLNEVIDRRLERLPADAVSLLEAIAVAGQAVTVDEAAHVSEQSSQVFATMTHMRSERLVRLIGSRDQQRVDTYHDKIRETVLDGLDDARRRELHLGFGEFLRCRQTGTATAKILENFSSRTPRAAKPSPLPSIGFSIWPTIFTPLATRRSFAYQLMAGEQSFRSFASEDAVEFLRRAEASMPNDAPQRIRHRLADRLATSLSRLKDFQGSFAVYGSFALSSAPSKLALRRAYRGIALNKATLTQYASAVDRLRFRTEGDWKAEAAIVSHNPSPTDRARGQNLLHARPTEKYCDGD